MKNPSAKNLSPRIHLITNSTKNGIPCRSFHGPWERPIKTISTPGYVSTIPFAESHKLIGLGIISAFHPLSIIDLEGKTGVKPRGRIALMLLLSIGFQESERKFRTLFAMGGTRFAGMGIAKWLRQKQR